MLSGAKTVIDVIDGKDGLDQLYGGSGSDTFTFTHLDDSTDTSWDIIKDFSQGQDKIDVSALNLTHISSFNSYKADGDSYLEDHNSNFSFILENFDGTLSESDFVWG